MTGTSDGRPTEGGLPVAPTTLVDALSALPRLDPVQRARVCPMLIDAAKTVLAGERNAAMLEATDRSQSEHVTQVDLAGLLGVTRTVITDGIRQALPSTPEPAPASRRRSGHDRDRGPRHRRIHLLLRSGATWLAR